MVPVGSHHVVALSQEAPQRQIQRLGDVGGEHHPVGPGTAKESRQLAAAVVDGVGGVQASPVAAPGAVAHGLHGGKDGWPHLGRLVQRGGGIVQIDHAVRSFGRISPVFDGQNLFIAIQFFSLLLYAPSHFASRQSKNAPFDMGA